MFLWPYNLFLTASEFEMQLSFNFLLCYLWKSCKYIRHLKMGKLNLRLKMRLTAQIHKKCNSWCSLTLLHNQILNLTSPHPFCAWLILLRKPLYTQSYYYYLLSSDFFTCGTVVSFSIILRDRVIKIPLLSIITLYFNCYFFQWYTETAFLMAFNFQKQIDQNNFYHTEYIICMWRKDEQKHGCKLIFTHPW